jgi:Amt family ammonium transporter
MNGGDTAWVLTSTALVLFMTIPGLHCFMAASCAPERAQRVDAMLRDHVRGVAAVAVCGYSLAFGDSNGFIGGLGKAMFAGVGEGTLKGHSRICVRAVSDDVRNHHARARRRRIC